MAVPKPFQIAVPQPTIDAILTRVLNHPWPQGGQDDDPQWRRGVPSAWLKDLCRYWASEYDWRAAEADLNRFPQFVSTIDGVDVHFLYVMGEALGRRPVLLLHGWPGAPQDFAGMIERLAFPSRFGGAASDAVNVIAPSLIGCGFSGVAVSPLGPRAQARVFDQLMTQVLGHRRYLAHGRGVGARVASWLALDHAGCAGLHLSALGLLPAGDAAAAEDERRWLAEEAMALTTLSRPNTLAAALRDSPVGALAWIADALDARVAVLSRDAILTTAMIPLVAGRVSSGLALAALSETEAALPIGQRIGKPAGFAHDAAPPPRTLAEKVYDVRTWSTPGAQASAVAADVAAFARAIGY